MTERVVFFILSRAHAVQRWLRRRFTKAGWLMLGGLVSSAIVGLDTTQAMAYQLFTFVAAILAVSLVSGLFFKPRLLARRILPRFGTVDESLLYRIVIKNQSVRTQAGLMILDEEEDCRTAVEKNAAEGGKLNAVHPMPRGNMLSEIWQELSRRSAFFFQPVPIHPVTPRASLEIPVEIMPRRRGPLRLSSLVVSRDDPFGLCRSLMSLPVTQSVLILPKRYSLPPIQMPGTRRYQPGGVSLAQSVGDSEEFISLRDYRPGDPLRRIHWRAWARTEKPVVKEYQDEYFVRHALILDTFKGDATDRAFEEAVSIAASFASSIVTQESLLDLMFVGTEAYCFTSGRGVSHADRMLEILASVIPCTDKSFETLPPMVLNRASMLSGGICILIAWDDLRKDFIRRLKALGIPLLALVVMEDGDEKPVDPEFTAVVKMLDVKRIREGLAGL